MPVRTGKEYIEGLRSHPREIWIEGERVGDVTEHPAFREPVKRLAAIYDMQQDPAHAATLTYNSPTSGEPVGTAFMSSRTLDDLVKRREAFRLWSEATMGMMGRAPDFLNTTLLALAEARDVFDRGGTRFGDNVVKYYEHVRENDLFLTHALIPPQTDRSKSSSEQEGDLLHLGVARETSDGLIVRGARMLATLAPIADELLVYNFYGLKPTDIRHSMVFAIPIDTPGLRQVCREPFDTGGRSSFDHPLATRFEEPDAVLIFDDVLVPWERVFAYNSVDIANAMYVDTNLRNYTAHQTSVRGLVKMQFALGIAMALARAVKTDGFLHVQEMLGECINDIELIKGCLTRAEVEHEAFGDGLIRPAFRPLQTIRTFLPRAYPRVIEVMQTLGAGGLLMMPTEADLASPIGEAIRKYFKGAEGMPSVDRIRLYKLAWDLCGDSFGARQLQYERYYAGDPVRNLAGNYLAYDKRECEALVARALELAGEPGKASKTGAKRSKSRAAAE